MAEVADWNPVDDLNNSAPPVGWPEGMVPSAVNNAARAMQGALRREHDRLTAGTLSLPYLPIAGGTLTAPGNLTLPGAASVTIGATQLQSVANGLQVFNAAGGVIQTRGPFAAFSFADRVGGNPDWQWYAQAGVATLYNGANRVTVSAAGNLTVTGTGTVTGAFAAASLSTGGAISGASLSVTGAVSGATATLSGTLGAANADIVGTVTAAQITSTANMAFGAAGTLTGGSATINGTVSAGGFTTGGAISGLNVTAAGTLTALQVTSTGNANITGTCTAANFVGNFAGSGSSTINTGTVTTTTVNASGTVSAANVTASSNVTAAGTVTGGSMVCNGTMQVSGTTNLLGTLNVGPSGSYARIDSVGTYNVSGSWLTFSDRSVKVPASIQPYQTGLQAILALNPVSFQYTDAVEATPRTHYGLMADEVEPVLPEMLGDPVDLGGQQVSTIAPTHAVWVLINACKALAAANAALEARVVALETPV